MRERGVWLLSVPVALGLALTACTSGGGHDATFSPTDTYTPPSHSTSPDPSTTAPVTTGPNVRPGEKPPVLPQVAKTNSNAGALAFAEYWERTIDWGYATVDSTLMRTTYASVCTRCEQQARVLDEGRSKRVTFRGGREAIISATLQKNDHHNGATAVVDVTFDVQQLKVADHTGKVVETDPATPNVTARVWARWSGGKWSVVDDKKVIYK
jgi:hypothetical protein